jgi:hypothetical protein
VGETPNVAARVQGLTAPDTVVISEATARLVQGYFAWQDLGPHALRGVPAPLQLYRVLHESGAQSRLDATMLRGLTPLVGREAEMTRLLEGWSQVQDGLGHVVLLSGEAGIGKSRLVQVLKDRVTGESSKSIEWRCAIIRQRLSLRDRVSPSRASYTGGHRQKSAPAWGGLSWLPPVPRGGGPPSLRRCFRSLFRSLIRRFSSRPNSPPAERDSPGTSAWRQ